MMGDHLYECDADIFVDEDNAMFDARQRVVDAARALISRTDFWECPEPVPVFPAEYDDLVLAIKTLDAMMRNGPPIDWADDDTP